MICVYSFVKVVLQMELRSYLKINKSFLIFLADYIIFALIEVDVLIIEHYQFTNTHVRRSKE